MFSSRYKKYNVNKTKALALMVLTFPGGAGVGWGGVVDGWVSIQGYLLSADH